MPLLGINCLFWNIYNKDLTDSVAKLVNEYQIDFLFLAENNRPYSDFSPSFEQATQKSWWEIDPLGVSSFDSKVKFYVSEYWRGQIECRENYRRLSIYQIEPKLCPALAFNLVLLHIPDKGSMPNESSYEECREYIRKIIDFEEKFDLNRTIVVGDFNMNPFEKGLVSFYKFNATHAHTTATKQKREVQDSERRFFYNPMWQYFGKKPYGTYYYRKAEALNQEWNIFNQVLFRPEIIANFDQQSLKIVTKIGGQSLVTKTGIPKKIQFSDHLPVYFRLLLPF